MSNNNVIITGVTGFIGYHLAIELAKRNNKVVGIDNNLRGGKESSIKKLINANIEYIECDLCDNYSLNNLCGTHIIDSKYIYHLAAYNGTQNFYKYPYKVIINSSLPTSNLLNFVVQNSVKSKILYTGSSESYAESVNRGVEKVPTDEAALVSLGEIENPRWSYSCAKTFGEYLLSSANIEHDVNSVIARVHNIYGPRMGQNHFFTDFILRALKKEFTVYGANQTRSFCHVSDCCNALISLMESNTKFGIYNIGSTNEININECANLIMKIMNIDGERLQKLDAPEGSVNRRCPDIKKINSLIGNNWERTNLKDGLEELVNWYSNKSADSEDSFK